MLETVQCRAMGYGKEVGALGTPHLQGWVTFKNARQFNSVRKKLKGCHVEIMKSRLEVNREYCRKEGDYTERGDIPITQKQKGDMEKERWANILSLAKKGEIEEIEPRVVIAHYRTLKKIADDYKPPPTSMDHLDNKWFYGPSGTGKSRKARTDYPGAYIKLNNKWWDGYDDQKVVIIEDLDKYDVALGGHLKRWCDHYPFPAEYKGGVKEIRPKTIIVTSNYHITEIWEDENTTEPLLRRFHVTHFDKKIQQIETDFRRTQFLAIKRPILI